MNSWIQGIFPSKPHIFKFIENLRLHESCMSTDLYGLPLMNEDMENQKFWPRVRPEDQVRENNIRSLITQLRNGHISIDTFLGKSFSTIGWYYHWYKKKLLYDFNYFCLFYSKKKCSQDEWQKQSFEEMFQASLKLSSFRTNFTSNLLWTNNFVGKRWSISWKWKWNENLFDFVFFNKSHDEDSYQICVFFSKLKYLNNPNLWNITLSYAFFEMYEIQTPARPHARPHARMHARPSARPMPARGGKVVEPKIWSSKNYFLTLCLFIVIFRWNFIKNLNQMRFHVVKHRCTSR